ncbi:glycoside hydrolase family 9 protein [Oleiagrimonas sp. C23AA]|uniref:glycoside hydrolase family 9 protein n=1 Tax=Oleiagrimonas sp. C23AA TaxID=2719047 RepID=UPI00141E9D94|nr:glycoside hydrolase family 9 protein [Oleiagrimonas sp. C23AA]NII09383.1 glycosyl hydrolase [Oleiagrimonas sp. C23AA]
MLRTKAFTLLAVAAVWPVCALAADSGLKLDAQDVLSMQGLDVVVHQNTFHPVFRDEKNAGIQIILEDRRIATDGEVRLMPTPEQWDPVPLFVRRTHGEVPNQLVVRSGYRDIPLMYHIVVTPEGRGGFRVAVNLDQPLPKKLVGKAGFNLDFLPSAYFGKSYLLGAASGIFPRHPATGPMRTRADGKQEPLPMAQGGHTMTLSPEDPSTRVAITSDTAPLKLYDARGQAQNGWFVVRALIPAGATKNAIVWHVHPHVVPGWVRKPVVSYNQVGYTPRRAKVAMIELDPNDHDAPDTARVMKVQADGSYREVYRGPIKPWGRWLRYNYARFDFSSVHAPGIYAIRYQGHTFGPFRIAPDLYAKGVWQPSLDSYLAVEMDHVKVRENYRVWHGDSHRDDARQAPPNHVHFDGYRMGAHLDSPFKAGQHVPGLNVGGWFDAGDYDIRTQSQDYVVRDLAMADVLFHTDWDNLSVDEKARKVTMRQPDGVPDAVQQARHGALQLLAQYHAFGHAALGIIAPTLHQYTHLGDAASKTDGLIYDSKLGPLQRDGVHSGVPDDRWVFTTRSSSLDYLTAGALASASRTLRDHDAALAQRCLTVALKLWAQEHAEKPAMPKEFGMTGGPLRMEEAAAAVQLILATHGRADIKARLKALQPAISRHFDRVGWIAVQAIPYMDARYKASLKAALRAYKTKLDDQLAKNPFGVPISRATWGGAGQVSRFAFAMYMLHKAFPDVVGTGYTLRGFDYILGRHPASNLSMVSAVGTQSRLAAYGNNRADDSFIAGGLVPGVLIVKPDFPEMKAHWPFLWYESEYVIDTASSWILTANAAQALTSATAASAAP